MKKHHFCASALFLLAGCSASLEIYDENNGALAGLPVRSPVMVEITTETTYTIDPTISGV